MLVVAKGKQTLDVIQYRLGTWASPGALEVWVDWQLCRGIRVLVSVSDCIEEQNKKH